jgi:pimeloyl-ACP methyl ester carboxylesterase
MSNTPYLPKRSCRSQFLPVRGLNYHLRTWGDPSHPLLVMVHGWMDVSASFQFLVDCLQRDWYVVAPDWRGYGLTMAPENAPVVDTYWFADYLADLDAILHQLSPDAPVRLVAHSLGGSVATIYAGVRASRIQALVNLEGYGLSSQAASLAPKRYAQWLNELAAGASLRDYASLDEVALRLQKNNPRLRPDQAQYLAPYWSRQNAQGRYDVAADPAHKQSSPILYREEEVNACWQQIQAPVLLVDSDTPDHWAKFAHEPAYSERLKHIANVRRCEIKQAGHMLHHDQPEQLASLMEEFLP